MCLSYSCPFQRWIQTIFSPQPPSQCSCHILLIILHLHPSFTGTSRCNETSFYSLDLFFSSISLSFLSLSFLSFSAARVWRWQRIRHWCHATSSTWSHTLRLLGWDVLPWTWCMCRNISPTERVWARGGSCQSTPSTHPHWCPCLAFQSCVAETWRPCLPLCATLWSCPRSFCFIHVLER